jgi:transposase
VNPITKGVPIGRRSPPQRGPFSTPKHNLPPYSPDLSPIEPAWAKFKSELREVGARTVDALHAAIGPALRGITAQDAAGFFRHCGYNRLE